MKVSGLSCKLQASMDSKQEAMLDKLQEQFESENRETKDAQPQASTTGSSPRDKSLRQRGSMLANALHLNPQVLVHHRGSKASDEAQAAKLSVLDEPMDIPFTHKCDVLECGRNRCWVLKAGSKSTRTRVETPDSSDYD